MKKKVFCFDLDNTICSTKRKNYKQSKPKKKIIKLINSLYEEGHTIKIYTARYMGRNNDKIPNTKRIKLSILNQLIDFGVKYNKLFISKPSADIYIDDKAYGYNKNWIKDFTKFIKK
tara:strand:+ start:2791 stop:3141 length:351 start_codon:yes stop_codon:yes gene_type:complete